MINLAREILRDGLKRIKYSQRGYPLKPEEDELHLQKTMGWLMRAVENGKGGVSSHYSLISGKWLDPFPETTGYIIPTFFDYASFSGDRRYHEAAVRLADWLGSVQLENGACRQGTYNPKKSQGIPIIFNTGQNIFGFLRAYRETGQDRFLRWAEKAGDFLARSTNEQGLWDKHLLRNLEHTINSRTAWALLELHRISPKEDYVRVAERNLDWVLARQRSNGWFENATSREGKAPNTHFISYTCEGLFGAYGLTKNAKYIQGAQKTADVLLDIFDRRGMLFAFWDENWKNRGKYFPWTRGKFICLTGNAQISMVWMALFEETGDPRYLAGAAKMIDHLKALQDIETNDQGTSGGLKGSFPVYGSYSALKYPNWAAKFFADALMMKIRLKMG